jgi:hypothetical protein
MRLSVRKDYSKFLSQYPWEWYVTFSASIDKINIAEKHRLNWMRSLCKEEHVQLACAYVLEHIPSFLHYHILCLARNSHGKTLDNIDKIKWQNRWPYDNPKVEAVRDQLGAIIYTMKHAIDDATELEIYNIKLLNKVRQ